MSPSYAIVIPSVGRPCLAALLRALAAQAIDAPIFIVDDRSRRTTPLLAEPPPARLNIQVIAGAAAGPAAARNRGWRATDTEWVAFVDDDVIPHPDWAELLAQDLAACGPEVAATQGQIHVPLPSHRRPTDWERNVAGLETARWATADMAYRRTALDRVDGFDERFPRAYREDADLGLRVIADGWRITTGKRAVDHPVRPAPWHVSVGKQAGNADDALMDRLHGPDWRTRAAAPAGRRPQHLLTVAAAALAATGLTIRNRSLAGLGASLWGGLTARFAWQRIAPGPRTANEVAALLATSVAVPPVAVAHWMAGRRRARYLTSGPRPRTFDAVLLDRDGTLVVDVPYNGDPDLVQPIPGAKEALDRLRASGVALGLVTNQSGIARGLISHAQAKAVNDRVAELLGPFEVVMLCPHGEADRCECRKPQPGMILKAAAELGVSPDRCVVIGDIGSDVAAAQATRAQAVLVPNAITRSEEIEAAPVVAPNLAAAVDHLLGARR